MLKHFSVAGNKDVIVIVFHGTIEKDYVVPKPPNEIHATIVHCIFNEDEGLRRCPENDVAIDTVKNRLQQVLSGKCYSFRRQYQMFIGIHRLHKNQGKNICSVCSIYMYLK